MSSVAVVVHLGCYYIRIVWGYSYISETDGIPTHSPVSTGRLLLLSGLCPLANGVRCGPWASTGDGLWLVSTHHLDSTVLSPIGGVICPISMQSIQNLGLALISMVAGTILDTRGYLILEVFFCTCVCSEWFRVCVCSCSFGSLDNIRLFLSQLPWWRWWRCTLWITSEVRRGPLRHSFTFLPRVFS